MKRGVSIAIAILVVVGFGVWLWVSSSLDRFLAHTIESAGSAALGVSVRVGSVATDLRAGSASVQSLRVANPAGFSSAPALELGEADVSVDLASLGSSPLRLPEIRVVGAVLRVESDDKGRINLEVLRDGLPAAKSTPEPAAEGKPVQLVIGHLQFAEAELVGDAAALGEKSGSLALPDVELRDVRGTPSQVGRKVADALLRRATETLAKATAGRAAEKAIDEHLSGATGDAARGLLHKLEGK